MKGGSSPWRAPEPPEPGGRRPAPDRCALPDSGGRAQRSPAGVVGSRSRSRSEAAGGLTRDIGARCDPRSRRSALRPMGRAPGHARQLRTRGGAGGRAEARGRRELSLRPGGRPARRAEPRQKDVRRLHCLPLCVPGRRAPDILQASGCGPPEPGDEFRVGAVVRRPFFPGRRRRTRCPRSCPGQRRS